MHYVIGTSSYCLWASVSSLVKWRYSTCLPQLAKCLPHRRYSWMLRIGYSTSTPNALHGTPSFQRPESWKGNVSDSLAAKVLDLISVPSTTCTQTRLEYESGLRREREIAGGKASVLLTQTVTEARCEGVAFGSNSVHFPYYGDSGGWELFLEVQSRVCSPSPSSNCGSPWIPDINLFTLKLVIAVSAT